MQFRLDNGRQYSCLSLGISGAVFGILGTLTGGAIADCLARGFDRTGFFEVDTGEQRAWTVQLTESNETPAQRVPGIPGTVGPGQGGLPGMPGGTPPGASGLPPAPGPKK